MIIISKSRDPFFHLAVEEVLIERASVFGPTLFLYVNAPSVIIGKHQNPWFESSPELLKKSNIQLCRRCSGGGAVYHDFGNLNYAFIMPKNFYDEKRQFSVLFEALKSFGICSELDLHKSIFVSQKKFSGTAFAKKINGFMQHGTLLVNSSLKSLTFALTPELPQSFGKAVGSRRTSVINLSEIHEGLNVYLLQKALVKSFGLEFASCNEENPVENLKLDAEIEQKRMFLKTWNWVFDKTYS